MKKTIEITIIEPHIEPLSEFDRHLSLRRVIAVKALLAVGRRAADCGFVCEPGPTGLRVRGFTIEDEASFRRAHGQIAHQPDATRHLITVCGTAPCPAWIHRDRFVLPPWEATVDQLRGAVLRRLENNLLKFDRDSVTTSIRLSWSHSELPDVQVHDDLGELTTEEAIDLFALSTDEGWRDWQRSKTVKNFTACEKIR